MYAFSSKGKITQWIPRKYSRICSAHFINGKKNDHPDHPGYIPTIFPNDYRRKSTGENGEDRFLRRRKRAAQQRKTKKINMENLINEKVNKENEEIYHEVETEMPQQNMENINKMTDFSCQVRNLQINFFHDDLFNNIFFLILFRFLYLINLKREADLFLK